MCAKKTTPRKHPSLDTDPSVAAVPRPETWGQQIAHWVSQAGSPPVMGIVAALLILARLSIPGVWMWIVLYILLAMIVPLGFLLWQLHQGQVTDLDIHFRQQRTRSFLVTSGGFLLAWITMTAGRAPTMLRLVAGTGLLQWLTLCLITLRWKISVHAASAAGTSLILLWGLGIAATPVVIAVPLVAWSRVKLRRHTPAQVAAGVLLGCTVFAIALLLTPSLRAPGVLAP